MSGMKKGKDDDEDVLDDEAKKMVRMSEMKKGKDGDEDELDDEGKEDGEDE
jgi:hypothetical protein